MTFVEENKKKKNLKFEEINSFKNSIRAQTLKNLHYWLYLRVEGGRARYCGVGRSGKGSRKWNLLMVIKNFDENFWRMFSCFPRLVWGPQNTLCSKVSVQTGDFGFEKENGLRLGQELRCDTCQGGRRGQQLGLFSERKSWVESWILGLNLWALIPGLISWP